MTYSYIAINTCMPCIKGEILWSIYLEIHPGSVSTLMVCKGSTMTAEFGDGAGHNFTTLLSMQAVTK